jgi:hypothetical protein
MGKRGTTEELARILRRDLFVFTEGRPMEWRKAVGGALMYAAMEHAVENGWLIVDEQDSSMCCLTDEGSRLARKTLS